MRAMADHYGVTADTAFAAQPIELCGREFFADRSGAVYWPAKSTLIIADLHLEKGSAHARRGVMLPPYDTAETLRRLADVIGRTQPACVVALGDSLHDRGAFDRLGAESRNALEGLRTHRTWIWVTGNHDPEIDAGLGGEVVEAFEIGGLRLLHVPHAGAVAPEIAGHLHPAARVSLRGSVLRRPCFIGDGRRLILPAFGAFTGGLNVLDEAFSTLLDPEARKVWLLGQAGVYPVPFSQLGPD